jgi:hypothetical protein
MTSRSTRSRGKQNAETYSENLELQTRKQTNEYSANTGVAGAEPNSDAVLLDFDTPTAEEAASDKDLFDFSKWIKHMMSAQSPLLRSSAEQGLSNYSGIPSEGQGVDSSWSRSLGRRTDEHRNSHTSISSGIGFSTRNGIGGLDGIAPFLDDDNEDNDTQRPDLEEAVYDEENPPDNSPYPQVRASVSATDNFGLSISTPRMWILSLMFALFGSATNLFFSLRYPSVAITPIIALILVHPLGLAWDIAFKRDDDRKEYFENGVRLGNSAVEDVDERISVLRRFRIWLGQGRWNEKEHACVYISSNVSFGFAFATDVKQKAFQLIYFLTCL